MPGQDAGLGRVNQEEFMEDWQQRVVDEQQEVQTFLDKLKTRREALADFIQSSNLTSVSESQQSFLGAQLVEMSDMLFYGGSYNSILLARIANFNGNSVTATAG